MFHLDDVGFVSSCRSKYLKEHDSEEYLPGGVGLVVGAGVGVVEGSSIFEGCTEIVSKEICISYVLNIWNWYTLVINLYFKVLRGFCNAINTCSLAALHF